MERVKTLEDVRQVVIGLLAIVDFAKRAGLSDTDIVNKIVESMTDLRKELDEETF